MVPMGLSTVYSITQMSKFVKINVPVQETLTSDELGTYVTYSVSVRTVEEEVAFVRDVSTDYEEIRQLTELCTDKELDPGQINDVIEDFLADPEMVLN